jgi:hypothetical protein
VIARDGRLLRGGGGQDTSFEDFTRTIGSGQTYDLLFRWTVTDAWIDPGGDPVPVQIPGLQDLVFKDDSTYHGGDVRPHGALHAARGNGRAGRAGDGDDHGSGYHAQPGHPHPVKLRKKAQPQVKVAFAPCQV